MPTAAGFQVFRRVKEAGPAGQGMQVFTFKSKKNYEQEAFYPFITIVRNVAGILADRAFQGHSYVGKRLCGIEAQPFVGGKANGLFEGIQPFLRVIGASFKQRVYHY